MSETTNCSTCQQLVVLAKKQQAILKEEYAMIDARDLEIEQLKQRIKELETELAVYEKAN